MRKSSRRDRFDSSIAVKAADERPTRHRLSSSSEAASVPIMVKKAKAGLAAKNDKFSEVLDVNERVLATVLDR